MIPTKTSRSLALCGLLNYIALFSLQKKLSAVNHKALILAVFAIAIIEKTQKSPKIGHRYLDRYLRKLWMWQSIFRWNTTSMDTFYYYTIENLLWLILECDVQFGCQECARGVSPSDLRNFPDTCKSPSIWSQQVHVNKKIDYCYQQQSTCPHWLIPSACGRRKNSTSWKIKRFHQRQLIVLAFSFWQTYNLNTISNADPLVIWWVK